MNNLPGIFFFFVGGVSYLGWMEKGRKGEMSPPSPLKGLFSPK